ncbi:hypothetical protein GE09DRAFT_1068458 [Coniochaeta sp. 2T2.1]|nr:hypothetical protein GE09DRAFT_1068458 [Coniochaeta sp. 2T2.1]
MTELSTRTFSGPIGITPLAVPLTTIFTQPSGCAWPIQETHASISTSCAPPEFYSVWGYGGFYSPAVCPSGYTKGCGYTDSRVGGQFSVTSSETAVWCVPSFYQCGYGPYASYTEPLDVSRVPAIQVRWRPEDISLFYAATHTTSTLPSSTTPAPTTASQAPTVSEPTATSIPAANNTSEPDTAPPPRPPSSSSLSEGAKAGTAVGVVLAASLLLGLFLWLWGRKRSRRPATDITPDVPHLDSNPVSELYAKNVRPMPELDAITASNPMFTGISPLGYQHELREADTHTPEQYVAELPAVGMRGNQVVGERGDNA